MEAQYCKLCRKLKVLARFYRKKVLGGRDDVCIKCRRRK
jgi:hypothetical protein